jgi:multisubunit Na+/H+ antiporter MnhG subunit
MIDDTNNNSAELETKKKESFWQKLKKTYLEYKPYLLSHHPNCEKYEEHVFKIREKKFCIGCFIGYPAAIVGIGVSFPLVFYYMIIKWIFLAIGVFLSFATLLSLTQFPKKRTRKILQKLMIGIGSGFILTSIWFFMEFSWYFKVLVIWGAIIVLNIPISLMHYKTHQKSCHTCEWKNDWSECPGFSRKLIEKEV